MGEMREIIIRAGSVNQHNEELTEEVLREMCDLDEDLIYDEKEKALVLVCKEEKGQ